MRGHRLGRSAPGVDALRPEPILAEVSLVFCVAMMVSWARTWWIGDEFNWFHGNRGEGLAFCDGHLILVHYDSLANPPSDGLEYHRRNGRVEPPTTSLSSGKWHIFGHHVWYNYTRFGNLHTWAIPLWQLALLTAVLPAYWFYRRRTQTDQLHLCAKCGYDLRATPERCPECGAVPAAAAAGSPRSS